MTLVAKNSRASVRDIRDAGSIPGSGRSPEGGHGNPLHYTRLGNHRDGGARWATVHRVTKSQIQLKRLSTDFSIHLEYGQGQVHSIPSASPVTHAAGTSELSRNSCLQALIWWLSSLSFPWNQSITGK